jgi:formylmethanofuran dehydrogenase subunit A
MLTRIGGGCVIDPANNRDEIGDVWIRDGRICAPPADGARADETYDATGKVVMAGAIDVHSHIAGAAVNTARLLLPESHRGHAARPARTPLSNAGWSTFETGCRYAGMGFTLVVEPAVSPHYALHAHLELADIPIIDKAMLAVLGNVDFLADGNVRALGNHTLGLNILQWLVYRDAQINIDVPKAPDADLFLPRWLKSLIGLGFGLVLPALLIGFGIARWARRRRR